MSFDNKARQQNGRALGGKGVPKNMRNRMTVFLLAMLAMIGVTLFRVRAQEADKQKPADKHIEEMMRKLEAEKKERKAALDKTLKEGGDRLKPLLAYSIEDLQLALSIKVRKTYDGARIVSDEDEPRFLGTVADEFDANSIFNQFGRYGSAFASNSIWNEFGRYGGQFATHSPFNPFSSRPPLLLKGEKVIGRLTVNRFLRGRNRSQLAEIVLCVLRLAASYEQTPKMG